MTYKITDKMDHQNDVLNSEYAKVSLAYFDLLGFRAFLDSNCKENPQKLTQIYFEILTHLDNEFNISEKLRLKYKVLSDGFIIWFDSQENEYFARLIQITYYTRRYLNRYAFLVRGGIVKGDHFIKGDVIVSPALSKAVLLEKKAKLPKIIIEHEFASQLRDTVIRNFETAGQEGIFMKELSCFLRFEREYIVEDAEGNLILHPTHGVEIKSYVREGKYSKIGELVCMFKNYRDHLNSNWEINKPTADRGIADKFEFLISSLNCFIDDNSGYVSQELKIKI